MEKKLIIGFIAAAISYATLSHADYFLHSDNLNVCESISGDWVGTAKAYNWLIGECIYKGRGVLSPLDSNGHFSLDVVGDKQSGSFICPSHDSKKLKGVCANGQVSIITEYGSIDGQFSEYEGNAHGTVSAGAGISAEVTVHFQRAG